MTLQNRVDPWGQFHAHPSKAATCMGNRGILHDESRRILRPWKGKAWVCCVPQYRGVDRKPLFQPNRYSELFFLDEVTAFAAGHRPCAYCQRARFDQFKAAWVQTNHPDTPSNQILVREMDALLHVSRAVRGGHAILAQPRYMVIGLTTAAVSWLAQIIGIHWTLHAYGMQTGIGVAGLVFLASTLVGLFPIVPGNVVVFQGATVAALTFATNVSADAALTFSIGLALIEAALGVGLGFFFLSYEGLSLGELRREAAASESRSAPS